MIRTQPTSLKLFLLYSLALEFRYMQEKLENENLLPFGKDSCFTERNSLRRSEFLNTFKITSLSYAFAGRKISIPEGIGK